jgi:hypothetical protein
MFIPVLNQLAKAFSRAPLCVGAMNVQLESFARRYGVERWEMVLIMSVVVF